MLIHWHIPDLDLPVAGLGVLVQVDVDGEMGIDVAHLVLEALGDTNDEVVDDGADGTESGNVLADAVVDLDADNVLLGGREVNGDVAQVLGELAAGALDRDEPRLDRDLDCWADKTSATLPVFLQFPTTAASHVLPTPAPIPVRIFPPQSCVSGSVVDRGPRRAFLSTSSGCTPG